MKRCARCGEQLRILDSRVRYCSEDCRKAARRAQQAAYYKANREKVLASYQENREKLLAYQAAYYQANREKILAYQDSYRKQHAAETADAVTAPGQSFGPMTS